MRAESPDTLDVFPLDFGRSGQKTRSISLATSQNRIIRISCPIFSFDPLPSQAGLFACVLELGLVSLLAQCGPFHVASSSRADWIRTHPDLPKLPVPKTLDQLQRLPRDLPHIFGFDRQVSEAGHPFVAGNHQATAEPRGSVCTWRTARHK